MIITTLMDTHYTVVSRIYLEEIATGQATFKPKPTVGKGKGVGDLLLKALIKSSRENEIWTLQAGIFPENKASIRLHKKKGFRLVGRREKIGKMKEAWRDTVLMERRSHTTGT